jgi:hypothetical protein
MRILVLLILTRLAVTDFVQERFFGAPPADVKKLIRIQEIRRKTPKQKLEDWDDRSRKRFMLS